MSSLTPTNGLNGASSLTAATDSRDGQAAPPKTPESKPERRSSLSAVLGGLPPLSKPLRRTLSLSDLGTHSEAALSLEGHTTASGTQFTHTASRPVIAGETIAEEPIAHAPKQPDAALIAPNPNIAPDAQHIGPAKKAVDDILSFVPASSPVGNSFSRLGESLGVGKRTGITWVNAASKKPLKDGLNSISTGVHNHFGYDAAPATEIVNAVAGASTSVASHSIVGRYRDLVNRMLHEDIQRFENVSQQAESAEKNTGYRRFNAMTPEEQDELKRDPTLPENQILTKSNGKWQYDTRKLARIARDDSHPLSQHARDVLTAMSIVENQGKRRDSALYQTAMSTLGVAASGALIGGSHGAVIPAVAAGHGMNAGKELLDMKKALFVKTRQNLRNEKADEMRRHVNKRIANGAPSIKASDLSGYTPQEQARIQAGIYAGMYDDARRQVAGQRTFGLGVPGRYIDESKAKVHKDAERDIVIKHINTMVTKGVARAGESTLEALRAVESETGQTQSQRKNSAMKIIDDDPYLKAAHTLMIDTGIPRSEAAKLLSNLSAAELNKRATAKAAPMADPAAAPTKPADARLSGDKLLSKIADIIGQPGLKPADALKDSEASIKKHLVQRS
jgi:hypothetical protein